MTEPRDFLAGNYRYIPGPFQYSAGVAAMAGHEIVRVRMAEPLPIAKGFAAIEAHLVAAGRPLTAFCACELRSPGQFTDAGFVAFNRLYVETLQRWDIVHGDDNPVARSNVCPELDPPAEPVFAAFSYTVPRTGGAASMPAPSFVIAGSGEAKEGGVRYADRIVRLGDTSREGMGEKVRFVLVEMERRMGLLGVDWSQASVTQAYSVFDIHPFLGPEMAARGAIRHGLTWYFARPPVVGLDFEMDVRGLRMERVAG